MIELQYLASQRPLWTAVIPIASGSLPRAEGSLKLPITEVHSMPNSWGLTARARLFATSLTSRCGFCKSISPHWPPVSLHSKQGLSVQNGVYCRLKKPSRKRKREREHSVFILSFLMWEMIPASHKLANPIYGLKRLAGFQRKLWRKSLAKRKHSLLHACEDKKYFKPLSCQLF